MFAVGPSPANDSGRWRAENLAILYPTASLIQAVDDPLSGSLREGFRELLNQEWWHIEDKVFKKRHINRSLLF